MTPIAVPNEECRKKLWEAMDAYAKADDPVQRSVCIHNLSFTS